MSDSNIPRKLKHQGDDDMRIPTPGEFAGRLKPNYWLADLLRRHGRDTTRLDAALAALRVAYEDVWLQPSHEGKAAFNAAFDELDAAIKEHMDAEEGS